MADVIVAHTGGDTDDIQVGIDSLANGDTCWVKNDGIYTMNGVDQQASRFTNILMVAISGFKNDIGDCDKGGEFYKDLTLDAGLPKGFVTIDGDNLSLFDGFFQFKTGCQLRNFKFVGSNRAIVLYNFEDKGVECYNIIVGDCITGAQCGSNSSTLFDGCCFDGVIDASVHPQPFSELLASMGWAIFAGSLVYLGQGSVRAASVTVRNCEFIGSSAHKDGLVSLEAWGNNVLEYSIFNTTANGMSKVYFDGGGIIRHNIFNKPDIANPTPCIVSTTGGSHDQLDVYNNIFVDFTNPIDDIDEVNVLANNVYWNCTGAPSAVQEPTRIIISSGDIGWVDESTGDFRLRHDSQIRNRGLPSEIAGVIHTTTPGIYQPTDRKIITRSHL